MAQRIVRQRREADNRVIPIRPPGPGVPDIDRCPRTDVRGAPEIAPFIQAQIQSIDLVPGSAKEGNHNRADVATIPRDKDSHRNPRS